MIVLRSVLDNLTTWTWLLPELSIVTTVVVILVLTWLMPKYQRYWLFPATFVGVFFTACGKYWLGQRLDSQHTIALCNQLLVINPLVIFFCWLLASTTLLMLSLGTPKTRSASKETYRSTYVVLLLGILLGSCLLMMASHWLTAYLSLTLLSLASTILIGMHATPRSTEASLKYWLFSMATTAVMLWGMSYFYSIMGTLSLRQVNWRPDLEHVPRHILPGILLLCLSGIFSLLAAVPYHFWLPDVYQGAPAFTVAYLSTIPKLAALVFLFRFFHESLPQLDPIIAKYSQSGIAILSLLTIIVGNTASLMQSNLQRLVAYGSIAQGGLLMASITASTNSPLSILSYGTIYVVMNLAAWLGVRLLQQYLDTHDVPIQHCGGLGRQFPVLGSGITVVMLSLIGLPPTMGFLGKSILFAGLWEHIQCTGSFISTALLVSSGLGTTLSLYYYARIPYQLFCGAAQECPPLVHVNHTEQVVFGCLVALLLLGFFAANGVIKAVNTWVF